MLGRRGVSFQLSTRVGRLDAYPPMYPGRRPAWFRDESSRPPPFLRTYDEPMPILQRETDIHPANLLDENNLVLGEGAWWAMYTLARREKELMRRLLAMDVPFYCPLIPQKNRTRTGRIRTAHLPLFPGYVFVHGDDEQRVSALKSNCISQTVRVPDSQHLLGDLRQIQSLIAADVRLTIESRIQPGQWVRVKTGPLRGVEGVVLKRHSGDRLLVSVRFLQRGASMAMNDFMVEAI